MLNAHALARAALAAMLRPVVPAEDGDICTHVRGAEASFPLQWRTDMDPSLALALVTEGPAPLLLGVPLVAKTNLQAGHACFRFTDEAYRAMTAHIISSAPAPRLPDPARDPVPYAIARMLMLARKGGPPGCPDDPACRAALWLALGIPDLQGNRQENRRLEAARALTGLMDGRPASERLALGGALGALGACSARLLAYAWKFET